MTTYVPIADRTSGLMQSILPTITMKDGDATVDRVVDYEVTSTPDLTSAAYPFDGSTEYGTTFSVINATPMSITIKKVAPLGSSTLTTTNKFNTIPVATHCREAQLF